MSEQFRCLPYRWILPIAQLLICAVVLWPIRSDFVFEIRAALHHGNSPRALIRETDDVLPYSLGQLVIDLHWERSLRDRERRLWTPTLLDIPVGLLTLPYAIHNPNKTEWTPKGMDFKTWRAITWPLVGMIFWWITGRGVEALLALRRSVIRPSIGWTETIVGVVFLMWAIILLIAPLCAGDSDSDVPWVLFYGAGAMWAVLGGAIIAARIGQRKIRLRLRDLHAPEASLS